MSKVIDIVQEKISPVIEKMGYEVVEIEYRKKIDGMNLTIYIDKPGGVTIDDCEIVHKTIDPELDIINPTQDEQYILNVSSCGLDRPLKNDNDYKRNIGKVVDIKLYKAINNIKEFSGKLIDYDEKYVYIENNLKIERNIIANMTLHLDF